MTLGKQNLGLLDQLVRRVAFGITKGTAKDFLLIISQKHYQSLSLIWLLMNTIAMHIMQEWVCVKFLIIMITMVKKIIVKDTHHSPTSADVSALVCLSHGGRRRQCSLKKEYYLKIYFLLKILFLWKNFSMQSDFF